MATVTITETKGEKKVKDKNKQLKEATADEDLESVINKVKQVDNTCAFTKCKKKVVDFAITCKYCNSRFCPMHGLPEIHGCGEAVRRDEKRKFLHPDTKLSEDKHDQAATKLQMKLKQLQQERKSKQGFGSKGKKK
ncbi:an1-like zinc finger [Holotrichia oblita]|uniref:An1-like zinc finger n=1 Tax=Holotrichia oblita TaxID=644536 RepID=A0ACB9TU99_HOLOL|nr:an1-like zinc finger [Holotrichia oblita]